jgi:hypothetical protein
MNYLFILMESHRYSSSFKIGYKIEILSIEVHNFLNVWNLKKYKLKIMNIKYSRI